MSKKNWYIYLLVFTLFSCDYFVLKKENREEILKEEWGKLNQNEVEEPPLFKSCQHRADEDLEICFRNTITDHIYSYLTDHTIKVKEAINDTIWVSLLITKDSEIILENFTTPNVILSQIPDFKDILEESINTLPEVEPAHTRSTPVTTRYKLPLVFRIN